jgi:tetratricopeptide (TPR) repeat protein
MAVVAIAFLRTLSAGTIWDDEYLTVRNPHLASWSGIWTLVTTDIWSSSEASQPSGYYRPLASLSFALNRLIGGNTALAYHAGNVVLHALVAVLLLRLIVVRGIATRARAVVSVVLFATLPLVAEPVSWIAGRYDLLGMVCALVMFEANRSKSRALGVPLMFLFAVWSKEPFAIVALLVALDDVLVWRRSVLRELLKYVSLATALGVSLLLRAWARVPEPNVLFKEHAFEFVRSYAFALKTFGALVIHPIDLCFYRTYAAPSVGVTISTIGIFIGCVGLAFRWWRRAPWRPSRAGVLFGALWCAIALVQGALAAPNLHIIGDRYAYFPLAGACVLLAGVMQQALRGVARRVAPALVLALAIAQTFRLESRLGELQSEEAMVRATLAREPDNFTNLLLYGQLLAHRGDQDRAEALLLRAREVAPASADNDIDVTLAYVHLHQRRFAEAQADARRALATNPNNPRAWVNLATALVDDDKPDLAVEPATRALALRPRYAYAHIIRGIAYLKLARYDDAHADVVEALAIEPSNTQARRMLENFHGPANR